jgi:glyoxylate carboligase
MSDRYMKFILTVIAAELMWLGVKDIGTPVSAQATQPTPVVIQAIDLDPDDRGALPVYSAAPLSVQAERPLLVHADRPLPVAVGVPLKVEIDQEVRVVAERPLPVRSVPYTPAERPGE